MTKARQRTILDIFEIMAITGIVMGLPLGPLAWAQADAAPAKALTYEEFVALVDKQHPERAIDAADLALARAQERRAGVLADPRLAIGRAEVPLAGRWQEMPVDDMASDQAQTVVSLSQSIPWPGALAAEERAAAADVARVERDVTLAELRRRFAAKELFLRMVRIANLIAIEQASLAVTDEIRELAHARFRQGIGSHMEFLQTHSESAILKANIGALTADLDNLKLEALGVLSSPDSPEDATSGALAAFTVDTRWPAALVEVDAAVAAPVSGDGGPNAVRERITLAKEAEISGLEAESKRSLPSFEASGMLMENEAGMRMYGATVGVSVPIFSHVRRRSLDQESASIDERAARELAWHDKQRALALRQVRRRIQQTMDNLRLLRAEVIPSLKEHVASSLVEYGQGRGSALMVIEGRRTLLNLEMAEQQALEALALNRLALEKVQAGFVEAGLEGNVPQLSLSSSMPGQSTSMGGMGGSGASPSSSSRSGTGSSSKRTPKSPLNDAPARSGDTPEQAPSGMGGMGM